MFGFSSGGSSIGGHFSANSFTNSPVSFGGSITQGDMTTGSVDQTSNTSSTGGTTTQGLDLSIPPIPALQQLYYTTGPVITQHRSDVSVDTHSTVQQSGSHAQNTTNDQTVTTTSVCVPPRYVDYTKRDLTADELYYLNNVAVPNLMKDSCYPDAQKEGY